MSFRLQIDVNAEADLQEAFLYLEEQVNGLGSKFLDEVWLFFEYIKANPNIFQKINENFRRAPMSIFSYSIFYRLADDGKTVIITAILSQSVNPRRWPS